MVWNSLMLRECWFIMRELFYLKVEAAEADCIHVILLLPLSFLWRNHKILSSINITETRLCIITTFKFFIHNFPWAIHWSLQQKCKLSALQNLKKWSQTGVIQVKLSKFSGVFCESQVAYWKQLTWRVFFSLFYAAVHIPVWGATLQPFTCKTIYNLFIPSRTSG